ncbi:Ig-like domain-containing protein [Streptococcus suis]|uniref:Ig-like domain-containing protein n=1 Tax=Streptococcus suis TaxID=1307 RepID=UPI003908974A
MKAVDNKTSLTYDGIEKNEKQYKDDAEGQDWVYKRQEQGKHLVGQDGKPRNILDVVDAEHKWGNQDITLWNKETTPTITTNSPITADINNSAGEWDITTGGKTVDEAFEKHQIYLRPYEVSHSSYGIDTATEENVVNLFVVGVDNKAGEPTVTPKNNGDVEVKLPTEKLHQDIEKVKVSYTGEDGKSKEVELTKKNGQWSGTQDVKVQGDTIILPGDKVKDKSEVTVTLTDKAKNESTPVKKTATADLKAPDTKVVVGNPNSLSEEEKEAVKKAVKNKNKDLPEKAEITVDATGKVTVKYPDNSTDELPASDVVTAQATSQQPGINPVDSDDVKIFGSGVPGATVKVTFPGGGKPVETTVGQNGKWNVVIPEGVDLEAGNTVSVTQTEPGKKESQPSTKTVDPTTADNTDVEKPDTPVVVGDTGALTDSEKEAVKQAVKNKNKDLPEKAEITVDATGKVTVKYPDNSTDELPASDVVTAQATSQQPGINPVDSDDVKIFGSGVSGATVKVTFPGGGKPVETTVGQNGKWNVVIPEGVDLEAGDTVSVTQTEPGKAESQPTTKTVDPTTADNTDVEKPDTPVVVGDTGALTDSEKEAVEDAIRDKNKDLPADADVTVGDNGDVTVTYPDGSTDTVPGTEVVKEQNQSATPNVKAVDSDDPTVTGTGVAGSTVKVTFPDVKDPVETTVGEDGNWSVNIPEGVDLEAGNTVSVTQTEPGKAESQPTTKTVDPTTADNTDVEKPDTPVVVGDTGALTDSEKEAVEDAIRDKNKDLPADADVTVGDNGDVTVTYPDGSTDTVPGTEVVKEQDQSATPNVKAVDSDDPTVTGTGVAGSTVKVTFPDVKDPVETTVGEDGNWSVNIPEGVDLEAGDTVSVTQTEPGKAESQPTTKKVDPTTADNTDVEKPDTPVVVGDTGALTDSEKEAVEDAIRDKNKDLPADADVTVGDNGDVTVTYPDGSTDTVPGTEVVKEQDQSATPNVKAVDSDDPAVTGTGVAGSTVKVTFPDVKDPVETTVGEDGNWSVNIPEGVDLEAGDTVSVTQTEPGKKESQPATKVVDQTTAEKTEVVKPDTPVVVGDTGALTDPEKEAVEDAIRDKNKDLPADADVTVGDNGDVTVTYPDGSTDTVPGTEVVKEQDQSATPNVKAVDSDDPAVTGTGVAGSTVKVTFPDVKDPVETTVGEDGNWSVNIPEGVDLEAGDTVSVTQTEPGKKESQPATKVVDQTTAEKTEVVKPDTPVVVGDTGALTDPEKEAVEDAIRDKNKDLPADADVTVGDNGDVTVTYPDGSTDTIPGADVVKEDGKNSVDPDNPGLTPGTPTDPSTIDTDGDGLPDGKEKELGTDSNKVDTDEDGFSDKEEVDKGTDPLDPNSKPGTPTDPSTIDTDGDGLPDGKEKELGTDSNKVDTDEDGFSDKEEVDKGTDPLDPNSKPGTPTDPSTIDTDGDGLPDGKEKELGTDSNKVDTDEDGFSDKEEVDKGTDPLDPNSKPGTPTDPSTIDTDGDGLPDGKEKELGTDSNKVDTDEDGFSDKEEVDKGTDPLDPNSKPGTPTDPSTIDTDGDGLPDGKEKELGTDSNKVDTDEDGFSDKEEVDKGTDPLDPNSKPGTQGGSTSSSGKASQLPKTGDTTNPLGLLGALLTSAGALIAFGKKRKKEQKVE